MNYMYANFVDTLSFTFGDKSSTKAMVEFLSIPPRYQDVVPLSPIVVSDTIGPVFLRLMHGPMPP